MNDDISDPGIVSLSVPEQIARVSLSHPTVSSPAAAERDPTLEAPDSGC